jgi:hypothetical protein
MRSLLLSLPLLVLLGMTSPPAVALASDGWCDTDPILVIRTPAGRLIPVFVNVGARNLLFTPNTLLGAVAPSYSATPTRDPLATSVTVKVTVPTLLFEASFATRSTISTGAFGTGTVYASTYGVSGESLTSTFQLPYR